MSPRSVRSTTYPVASQAVLRRTLTALNDLARNGLVGAWGHPDPRRAKHRRRALTVYGSLTKLVAMGLNQVEDASSEFISGVQIVSPPPDQNPNTIPARWPVRVGRRITAVSQFPGVVHSYPPD